MKNTMKKTLSLVLAIVIIVCTVPMAFAEGKTYEVGDIIEFGSYPQSEVKDETIIAELNALAPEWEDWTSYGYYSGTNSCGTMTQGDWMRYVDVTYNCEKYRGVKFTKYRPQYTTDRPSVKMQLRNGYNTNNIYWFKFEAIDWRVLDPNTGLVMCETIIDSQAYSNTLYLIDDVNVIPSYSYFNDSSCKNYANDYETSSIRQWLNEDFCNTAFVNSEKEKISTTTLNNDGCYTIIGWSGYEEFDSNPTEDKIFLLSYDEVFNSQFGFDPISSNYDTARRAQGSDYAKCQGLEAVISTDEYNGIATWILRSAGYAYSTSGCCVQRVGYLDTCNVYNTSYGIRPAFCFKDIEYFDHQHSYNTVVTEPTCTEKGYTTYTCECGESYVGDFVGGKTHNYAPTLTRPATHISEGIRTYTCSTCGDIYTESIAKTKEHSHVASDVVAPSCEDKGYTVYVCECGDSYKDNYTSKIGHSYDGQICKKCGEKCSCNCHKTGFMGFIWKITRFFNKLFKTNKTCACGVAHY